MKVGSLPIEFCRQFQAFTLLLYPVSPKSRRLKPPSSHFFSRLPALNENPVYRVPFNQVRSSHYSSCLYDRNLFQYCCILFLTNIIIINYQVIMATNRHDTLDPALLRPGRLDRKIEFPMPDRRQKRLIFSTITAKMNLSEEVDLEDCILSIFDRIQQSLYSVLSSLGKTLLSSSFNRACFHDVKAGSPGKIFWNTNFP